MRFHAHDVLVAFFRDELLGRSREADVPLVRADPEASRDALEAVGFVFPVAADRGGVTIEVRRRQRLPLAAFARGDLELEVVAAVERAGLSPPPAPAPPSWLAAPPAAQWGRPLALQAFEAMYQNEPYRPLQPRELAEAQGLAPRLYEPPARRGAR